MPSLLWKLKGFDIIHLHYPFYGGAFFTALASVIWGIPLVITYHMRTEASGWLGLVFKIYRAVLEPYIFGDAKLILVSSIDYADSVGLEKYPVTAQPFSVDADRFHPGSQGDLRTDLGIGSDSCSFIFVGGLDDAHYFKGLGELFISASRLPKDESWDLIVVGGGNLLASYEKQVIDLGITDRVHFLGRVSDEELPRAYQAADVHVLPSINQSEAFGLVTLEAAASGLPSLVSDLPGVRTLVETEKTGLVVELNDAAAWTSAMQRLVVKSPERESWGINARNMALEAYDGTTLLNQLILSYKSLRVGDTYEDRDNQ
jgi:glycosyltransferase involved in cell wall biosynthesis